MGTNSSTPRPTPRLPQAYTQSKHPRFSGAKYIPSAAQRQKHTSEQYQLHFGQYQISKNIADSTLYEKWAKKLVWLKQQMKHWNQTETEPGSVSQNHNLLLPNECHLQQQGLCGTGGILKITFDCFPYQLREEILNRKTKEFTFDQKQLWFLCHILVTNTYLLHCFADSLVGDIRPENILINEQGQIAICNVYSFPEEHNNFQKSLYYKEITYLPPQAFRDLKEGRDLPTYDQKLGESFSIGLTLLDTVLLCDHQCLYKGLEGQFNKTELLYSLQKLRETDLDNKFKKLLQGMLQINPQSRLSCEAVVKYLKPYEKHILNLEQFQIEKQISLPSPAPTPTDFSPQKKQAQFVEGREVKNVQENAGKEFLVHSQSGKNMQNKAQLQSSSKNYLEQISTPIDCKIQTTNLPLEKISLQPKKGSIVYNQASECRENSVFKTGKLFHREKMQNFASKPHSQGTVAFNNYYLSNNNYEQGSYKGSTYQQGNSNQPRSVYKVNELFRASRDQKIPLERHWADGKMEGINRHADLLSMIDKQLEESRKLYR